MEMVLAGNYAMAEFCNNSESTYLLDFAAP